MFMYKEPGTGQVVDRHYCSHEVPTGWFEGRNTRVWCIATNLWNPRGNLLTRNPATCGLHLPGGKHMFSVRMGTATQNLVK